MMVRSSLFLIFLSFWAKSGAQDTTRVLREVMVQAYQYERPLAEVPASIGIIDNEHFSRFSPASVLPAVNTVPGVRMEERSPGSYRFSIRGSLLRSPFGIRNVKMYWNNLPLTDAGGNTYLNLLDVASVEQMEIIKGPGGSLYGAGTGGVVLLNSSVQNANAVEGMATAGGYGLVRYHLRGDVHNEVVAVSVRYAHQQSEGYRDHTRMVRDALHADVRFKLSRSGYLNTTFLYSDLFYQTPGGLNRAQYEANPKQARPATNVFRGAAEQRAGVNNKTIYAGLLYDQQWNDHWSTRAGVYGSHIDFQNPFILNFEKRIEKNAGFRIENEYAISTNAVDLKITFGGEGQIFDSPVNVYNNNGGIAGQHQLKDDLQSRQGLLFAQTEFEWTSGWFLTLGASGNFLTYDFLRTYPVVSAQKKQFDPVLAPRVALLKKLGKSVSVFGNISHGFSPPTLAEVRPSEATINQSLNAERGTNYEIGWRGDALRKQLTFDVALYSFQLKETIVIQRNAAGQEYFINAGETDQRGIEANFSWMPRFLHSGLFRTLRLWSSYTYNHYRYKHYQKENQDYSGNRLPGVAPVIATAGLDVVSLHGLYLHITTTYTDHITLNDANDEYAEPFVLLGTRVGLQTRVRKADVDVFGGVDNALNQRYSLGNDLNAAGRRYYNTATARNFYIGLKVRSLWK
jgi:iron complex outermembrane recepter protein